MKQPNLEVVIKDFNWYVIDTSVEATDIDYFWEDKAPNSPKRPIVSYISLDNSVRIGDLPFVTYQAIDHAIRTSPNTAKVQQWLQMELGIDEDTSHDIIELFKRKMFPNYANIFTEDPKAMTIERMIDILERHNLWRRGADDVEAPTPTEIGEAIDAVVDYLKSYIQ